jgi:TonB family protein
MKALNLTMAALLVSATAQDEEIAKVGPGISPPVVLQMPQPGYSEAARSKRIQGRTFLEVVINPDGTVRKVEVIKPLGYGLDEEAVKAVKTWKFEPARKDGVPVAVLVKVEIEFTLWSGVPGNSTTVHLLLM